MAKSLSDLTNGELTFVLIHVQDSIAPRPSTIVMWCQPVSILFLCASPFSHSDINPSLSSRANLLASANVDFGARYQKLFEEKKTFLLTLRFYMLLFYVVINNVFCGSISAWRAQRCSPSALSREINVIIPVCLPVCVMVSAGGVGLSPPFLPACFFVPD